MKSNFLTKLAISAFAVTAAGTVFAMSNTGLNGISEGLGISGDCGESCTCEKCDVASGPSFETQRGFAIHDENSAHEATQEALDFYQTTFQFVPNLIGVMAESPALIHSYWQLQMNLNELGALTPPENNVVQMSMAVENECQYCVAGHTLAGKVFFNSTEEEISALRTESELPSPKLEALRAFSLSVYENKGRVRDTELEAFYSAGYTRQHALDVVANIAAKVMTNFTNQLAETPVDEVVAPLAVGLPFSEDRKLIER